MTDSDGDDAIHNNTHFSNLFVNKLDMTSLALNTLDSFFNSVVVVVSLLLFLLHTNRCDLLYFGLAWCCFFSSSLSFLRRTCWNAASFTVYRETCDRSAWPGGGVEAAALALLLSGAHMHRVLMSASSLFLVRSSRCNLHFVFRM